MADGWYYENDGEQQGPIPAIKLRQMAADGILSRDDRVMKEGWPDWVAAEKVKGLFTEARGPIAVPEPPKSKPVPAPVDDSPFSHFAEPASPPRGAAGKPREDEDDEPDDEPPPKPPKSSSGSKSGVQRPKVGKPPARGIDLPANPFDEADEPPPSEPAWMAPNPPVPSAPAKKVAPIAVAPQAPALSVSLAGKSVKLLTHGGQTIQVSLADLAALIRAGEISDSAMVSVETWLPVSTLKGMLGLSAPPASVPESNTSRLQEQPSRSGVAMKGVVVPLENDASIPFRSVITDDEPAEEADLDFWTEPEEKK